MTATFIRADYRRSGWLSRASVAGSRALRRRARGFASRRSSSSRRARFFCSRRPRRASRLKPSWPATTSIPAALERATDFREGQRLLLVGGLAAQALVIGALAVGRPRGARDLLARLSSRSVLGTAAAGVLVVVVAEAAAFPMTLAAHERSVDVGLSTQTLGPWLGDQAKGLAIGAIVGRRGRRRALRADSPLAAARGGYRARSWSSATAPR